MYIGSTAKERLDHFVVIESGKSHNYLKSFDMLSMTTLKLRC